MRFTNLNLVNTKILSYITPAVTNGLVFYVDAALTESYPGTGTSWYDLSGQGYPVSIGSGMLWNNDIGGSFSFDGTGNAWADVGDGFGYDYSAGLTVNVLAKFVTGGGAWERLIDFGNGPAQHNIILCRDNLSDNMIMDIEGINNDSLSPGEMPISWNQWAMYTMTVNNTYWKHYKNGNFYSWQTSLATPASVTRVNNYIGRSNWNGDAFFYGSMSVIQMYNRELTDDEILQNYIHFKQRANL